MEKNLIQALYILIGTIGIGVIAYIVRKYTVKSLTYMSPSIAKFVDTKLTFIGVIHHELSHALLAFLSGAKIIKITLFRFNSSNGNLGEVIYSPRGPWIFRKVQESLAGMAPIICGSVTLAVIYHYLILGNSVNNVKLWVGVILIMQISYHMTLSNSDIKSSISGIPILFVLVVIITKIFTIDNIILLHYYRLILSILAINYSLAFILRVFTKR